MDAAKQFVAQFTSKRGHRTLVDEVIRPAVTIETVKPTRHEIVTEAIDKEVHRHHYHTTIQPISHREVLPTKHTHNFIPVVHKDHTHRTRDANLKLKSLYDQELALFTNESVVHPTQHSKTVAPAVIGEHVHHHVHEIVQPIIFKETITPEVVHVSIPIHEVHHKEPIHHKMSELPLVEMERYTSTNKTRPSQLMEEYEGEPRPYNPKFHIDKHRPTPINTTATQNRGNTSTPPLSPASNAASSPGMPATPKNRNSGDQVAFRNSEDPMPDLSLSPHSPTAKKTGNLHKVVTPQRVRF